MKQTARPRIRRSAAALLACLACLTLGVLAPGRASAQAVWPPPSTVAAPQARTDELKEIKGGGAFGVGVATGTRSGLSMRVWPSRGFALDVNLGTTWLLNSLAADLSVRFAPKAVRNSSGTLAGVFSAGVGFRAQVFFSEASFVELAVRIPLGFSLTSPGWKLEPFAEVAPTVAFWKTAGFQVDGLVGARYYF